MISARHALDYSQARRAEISQSGVMQARFEVQNAPARLPSTWLCVTDPRAIILICNLATRSFSHEKETAKRGGLADYRKLEITISSKIIV